ncbi:hypothetical protein HBH56_030430 [Parastagonospora nodorum]|uniref:Uncharacterized protein n=1 Tax=Phaeosphaeria nodorum (strain SN15 / ATCC MYA-4574 / FGSC 10173) TaxID=321614 RepID=A0A7U2F5T4_PHANO|nr:hypothetical protein HBH56_030430 [Parastagonospora nodorum]QRC99279.1 hypothetical protein JI435_413200 [Parastagonospora nodorum SN15]KAH3934299.1 hypothetical protein HBH54_051580 [Parastagonospora nodorum]KAH3985191.1 hypothetical protein HBH52_050430 [Parastagonospora nodorum]KAH4066545.1 hypothetical protein HBH50_150530 [Parastagonospora nodorum]
MYPRVAAWDFAVAHCLGVAYQYRRYKNRICPNLQISPLVDQVARPLDISTSRYHRCKIRFVFARTPPCTHPSMRPALSESTIIIAQLT